MELFNHYNDLDDSRVLISLKYPIFLLLIYKLFYDTNGPMTAIRRLSTKGGHEKKNPAIYGHVLVVAVVAVVIVVVVDVAFVVVVVADLAVVAVVDTLTKQNLLT